MSDSVLSAYGVSEGDRIGEGGESTVYQLPAGMMLRVYKNPRKKEFLTALKVLYEGITDKFSFKTPRILEIKELDGVLFSINEMIPGRAMSTVLPTLSPDKKKILFQNYFDAMEEVRGVSFPERPYGQILSEEQILQGDTWTEFLEKSIRKCAAANAKFLTADIEDFSTLLEMVVAEAHKQPPHPEKTFVHGDFFPNNILVNDALEISGVIDVSALSVVGDCMMDVSSSYFFLETTPGVLTEDAEIYRAILFPRYDKDIKRAIDFYSLYYAIVFGFKETPEAEMYPALYDWSVHVLKNFQKA